MDAMTGNLGERFNPRANAVGFLRLALALTVVVSHTWPLGGYGHDPGRSDNSLGALAVEGFFALSGFLIVGSALRSPSVGRFLWHRVLRIFPGFWASLVVVAVAAVVFARATGGWAGDAGWYVVRNLGLHMNQYGIGDTLAHTPNAFVWNGPLYTLAFEFTCYLVVALLIALRLLRPGILTGLTVVCWGFLQVQSRTPGADDRQLKFTLAFLVGGLLCLLAKRVRVDLLTVGVVGAIAVGSYTFGGFVILGIPAFAYLCLVAACWLPFHRVGGRVDLSYGVYVYAWPVQQVLFATGLTVVVGPGVYLLAVLGIVLPLAAVSWFVVEAPALRLKGVRVRQPASGMTDARIGVGDEPAVRLMPTAEPTPVLE